MRYLHLSRVTLYAIGMGLVSLTYPHTTLSQSTFPNTAQFDGFTLSYSEGWSALPAKRPTMLLNVPPNQVGAVTSKQVIATPQIHVSTEQRTNIHETVSRLKEIAAERSEPSTSLKIAGWSAIQRRYLLPWTQLGYTGAADGSMALVITTAIAAGNQLIRLEASMPADTPARVVDEVIAIEQSVMPAPMASRSSKSESPTASEQIERPQTTPADQQVTGARPKPKDEPAEENDEPPLPSTGSDTAGNPAIPGIASRLLNGGVASEPEVAVSTDGRNVVVAQQITWTYSNDGGLTFNFGGTFPNTTGGDSSLAYGLSTNFYEATIFNSTTAIHRSIDSGKTFQVRGTAFTCTNSATQCGFNGGFFPDQEHIAADRTNAASGGGDQVYSVFRNGFVPPQWGIVCSTDGGATWSVGNNGIAGDFPRVAVSQDGSAYVAYVNGSNMMINKFASCNTNSALPAVAGFPKTVATGINDIPCPVPGLDRCNNGNTLRSPMVAIDDTSAAHIFYSYATNTGAGNENIVMQDSTDSGATWRPAVKINGGGTARRFMPWVCATKGTAYVSWYDRRNATGADNDLTDFFGNSAALSGGNLTAGTEFQIDDSGASDAQCEAGQPVGSANSWPGGSRSPADSGQCSRQPQLGGQCQHSPPNNTDSATACNLNPPSGCTVMGETCQTASGSPKYGDYNGNACAQGHLYTVWASATPARATNPGIDLFFKVFDTVLPTAVCQNVTTSTDAGLCTASGVSIDNGSTDPDNDTFTLSQSPANPYPKGTTSVKLTITDQNGQTNSCMANVTVNDNEKPKITCLSPKLECTSPAGAVVPTLIDQVSDNCAIQTKGCSPAEGSTFPLGVDPFTCTATDTSSNTNSCTSSVTITDTTPPTINSVVASPNMLWPPSHKLTSVAITVTASDICDTSPKCQIVSVSANEPVLGPGSGNTDPDWIIDNPGPKVSPAKLGVQLRGERAGGGAGRIYTIGVSCSDASNNTSAGSTTVTVAHDQGM